MKKSIASVCLSGTLVNKLKAASNAKFDGVEIFENDLLFSNLAPRDVRKICADLNLTIDLYQPFRDFEGVDEAQLQKNILRLEQKFEVMEELGCPMILVCSNATPHAINDLSRSAAQMFIAADLAAKRGFKIGFEALSWGTHINRFDEAYAVIEEANHPALGLVVDSFHTLALPHDWSSLSNLKGNKIFFAQLCDAPRMKMDLILWARHFRNLPFQGDLDVLGFTTALLKTGYTGTLSLEIFNDDFRANPARHTAEDAMRSLLMLEEKAREQLPSPRRVPLFDPPPAQEIKGVSFAEFAVDVENQPALEQFLKPLGFQAMGKHRSKAVSLWGLGQTRFVLNNEPNSFAASFQLMHGVSVCALALEVDDASLSIARAESYGLHQYMGKIGANEHLLPAVRGEEGGLFYFTDKLTKTTDFESDFHVETTLNGDERFDHVAFSLPEGQLESFVLFYRAILGLSPEETFVLTDPMGIVRSKAMSNASKTIRFPLNISDSRNTATARSVQAFSGAGVHHIAIETQDIFVHARAMQAKNAAILPIHENYYLDLASKYDLDETLLADMQMLNILYDKIGESECFHLYTLPFEGRFFMEFIERRQGYTAYAQANAGMRLASLALSQQKMFEGL